jgi:opacity protein-like surface antigen
MLPSPAQAQSPAGARAGSWEFLLPINYSTSTSFSGQGGASADLNSDVGMGLGVGYNLNNHLQLGGNVTWSSRSYNATLVDTNGTTRRASGTLDSSTLAFNATYFFLPSGITPFVSAGIGSTFIDSNIPNGAGATTCWYDPWFGTICDTATKTQTAVSYTGGVGFRFAVNRAFSLQGSYNRMWIDLSNSKPEIDVWKVDLVFRM